MHSFDIPRWIISTIGGSEAGQLVQKYLNKMILAMESYFEPVNSAKLNYHTANNLHQFISVLCDRFIRRLHIERYDKKWSCHSPLEKRLTDTDIEEFILGLKPVIFHMIFNRYRSEHNIVFNTLSTIRPDLIIPTLIKKFKTSLNSSTTEPHKLTACLATLRVCSRPLVENYPLEVIQILKDIISGITINDIWKSQDILALVNSLLEMIWPIDFSGSEVG